MLGRYCLVLLTAREPNAGGNTARLHSPHETIFNLSTVERLNLRFTVPPGIDFDRIETNLRYPSAMITTER